MNSKVKAEVEELISGLRLSCSVEEFQEKVDWVHISRHKRLSEDLIREFHNKVHWGCISENQKLSEDFIREFQDKVNWNCISRYQKLSEVFIIEFQDKVNWGCILAFQNIFKDFAKKFRYKLNSVYKVNNKKIPEPVKTEPKVRTITISKEYKISTEGKLCSKDCIYSEGCWCKLFMKIRFQNKETCSCCKQITSLGYVRVEECLKSTGEYYGSQSESD
jgi:hypothetical protein